MKYKETLNVLKERNDELLAFYMKQDDEKNVKLHFVIKSILSSAKPFTHLNADVSMNILKDLNFTDQIAFDMYKVLVFGKIW